MPEPQADPLDRLRTPFAPLAPDAAFAAALRDRLVRAVLASDLKETAVTTEMTSRARNGARHGDVSYITLGLPDLARGRAFYGAVLGWQFSPGSSEDGAQVDGVVPMIGLWAAEQPVHGRVHGTVLGYRVDDIVAAVAAVRAHRGSINDPHQEPYGMAAEGHDDQGVPLYLHEMPSVAADPAGAHGVPGNGQVEGDVSYLTMVVPDLEAAQAFYSGVFGWTFDFRPGGGGQVSGVSPQMGMTSRPEAGPAAPGAILCYRVDDIAAAVGRVRDAGGEAREVVQRPYGLEALCADDQGTPFYLHQF